MPTIKQNLKSMVKVSRKTFFNPAGWLGYELFINQVKTTIDLARGLFVPAEATRKETFAAAMMRLKLNDADVKQIYEKYLLFVLIFGAVGIGLCVYGLYLLIHHGTFAGFLLGFAAGGLALVNAFRFHFLAFQIRHRKLGCTVNEWWSGKITERDNKTP